MNDSITAAEITDNPSFWHYYFCWFRGYDAINELNMDDALEGVTTAESELDAWHNRLFSSNDADKTVKALGGTLNQDLRFDIEFQENEIVFFLNDVYIGNLGGHFEAWFLTLDELIYLDKFNLLFLLLLPMTAIEKRQQAVAKILITEHLKIIPLFDEHAEYIAECILAGLIIDKNFSTIDGVGIVNSQNHSVRNIEKYPRYIDEVKALNLVLDSLISH